MSENIYIDDLLIILEDITKAFQRKAGISDTDFERDINSLVINQLKLLNESLIDEVKIKKIITYSLSEIVNNWEAFHILAPNETSNMHLRKIFECVKILDFLISHEDKWDEYEKKWTLYPLVTTYKRWSKLDFDEWHPDTRLSYQKISPLYEATFNDYKSFLHKSKKNTLTGSLKDDLKHLKDIKHWYSPRSFTDILKDVGMQEDSIEHFYQWWSDSIHLSPVNQGAHMTESTFGKYYELGATTTVYDIANLIQSLSPLTNQFEYFYFIALAISSKRFHEDQLGNIHGFEQHLKEMSLDSKALIAIASKKMNIDEYVNIRTQNFDVLEEINHNLTGIKAEVK